MAARPVSPNISAGEPASFAAKELSEVEISRAYSNQHEFHAGNLRRALGFSAKTSGELVLLFYETQEPFVVESKYTIYDAREGTDRTEWRLYYYTNALEEYAAPGDLLVIARPDPQASTLHGVVARRGSDVYKSLRAAFELNDHKQLARFSRVTPSRGPASVAESLADALVQIDGANRFGDLSQHELFKFAIDNGNLPPTADMAAAADKLVQAHYGDLGPDAYLDEVLKAETVLFEAIEEGLGNAQLRSLLAANADYNGVMKFALSRFQSRKTRRGTSLQNHVQTLLLRYGVPHTAQCTTEGKERPDFILPSCRDYHDASFPAERLRMVGCKSKLRDRWRQYLTEARRIPIKHHICLDEDLSDDVISAMHAHDLRTCMPRRIIDDHYSQRPIAGFLMNIEELVSELRSAAVG